MAKKEITIHISSNDIDEELYHFDGIEVNGVLDSDYALNTDKVIPIDWKNEDPIDIKVKTTPYLAIDRDFLKVVDPLKIASLYISTLELNAYIGLYTSQFDTQFPLNLGFISSKYNNFVSLSSLKPSEGTYRISSMFLNIGIKTLDPLISSLDINTLEYIKKTSAPEGTWILASTSCGNYYSHNFLFTENSAWEGRIRNLVVFNSEDIAQNVLISSYQMMSTFLALSTTSSIFLEHFALGNLHLNIPNNTFENFTEFKGNIIPQGTNVSLVGIPILQISSASGINFPDSGYILLLSSLMVLNPFNRKSLMMESMFCHNALIPINNSSIKIPHPEASYSYQDALIAYVLPDGTLDCFFKINHCPNSNTDVYSNKFYVLNTELSKASINDDPVSIKKSYNNSVGDTYLIGTSATLNKTLELYGSNLIRVEYALNFEPRISTMTVNVHYKNNHIPAVNVEGLVTIKDHNGEPYTGTTYISTGKIAKDLPFISTSSF